MGNTENKQSQKSLQEQKEKLIEKLSLLNKTNLTYGQKRINLFNQSNQNNQNGFGDLNLFDRKDYQLLLLKLKFADLIDEVAKYHTFDSVSVGNAIQAIETAALFAEKATLSVNY